MFNIEEKLKNVICSCGNDIDYNRINYESDLVRDYGFSSIDFIQLVLELENVFKIEIDNEYLLIEKLSSYKSLIQILSEKVVRDKNDN